MSLGSGESLVGAKAGTVLNNKSLTSASGAITFSSDADEVDLDLNKTVSQRADVNSQTGTTFTPGLTDAEKIIYMNNASSNVFTIQTNASIAYPVDTLMTINMEGVGVTSITGDTGVTLNGVSAGSAIINGQYQAVTIQKRATNTWIMFGAHGTVA